MLILGLYLVRKAPSGEYHLDYSFVYILALFFVRFTILHVPYLIDNKPVCTPVHCLHHWDQGVLDRIFQRQDKEFLT